MLALSPASLVLGKGSGQGHKGHQEDKTVPIRRHLSDSGVTGWAGPALPLEAWEQLEWNLELHHFL